ncbi:E3 ubiquitin-protein ligase CBL [Acipenser ruthenus]|uniref:E3 ubiquitin-protein ligase CBL n=1 Tax=Acipenser ruthenus TaxID=7906 RepID=A0A444V482_ACIRT|nr:E3 ubiquitin-protein ligase CBL [Acipenser ruthenus]
MVVAPVDQRTVDRTCRHLEKLNKLCQNPKLGLRNSPPYLLELVPDSLQHLQLVVEVGKLRREPLWQQEYFCVYLRNLQSKTQQAIRIFKEGKDKITSGVTLQPSCQETPKLPTRVSESS